MLLKWSIRSLFSLGLLSLVTVAGPACSGQPEPELAPEPAGERELQSARVPAITAVNPPLASSRGGTSVTITGRSFQPGAQVFIAGQPAAYVYALSSTQLTATLASAALPAGPAEVKVVNPDGRQGARSDVLTLFSDTLALLPLRAATFVSGMQVVATPDLNGDGLADLVLSDSSRVRILLARGRNDFSESQTINISSGMLVPVEVGDFNGDGKIDLLVVAPYFTSEASVYLNRGDGTFGAPVTTTVSVMFPFNSIFVSTGDINGDGRKDLLAVGSSFLGSTILSLLAQSDGRLATPIVTALTQQIGSAQLRDINGDGKADIVAASSNTSEVLWFAGSSDGKFAAPVASAVDAPLSRFVLADYNGDGKLDLAGLGSGGKLSVRTGRGDGTFTGTTLLSLDAATVALATGDVTGDGKVDLVVGSSATYSGTGAVTPGSAALLAGNGDGTFAASRAVKLGPLQGANDVRIVDADKDGKQDLVVSSVHDGSFSVLYGRGGGSFLEDTQLPAQATALAHADLNGDSKVDVVAVSVSTNKLYVLLGNGDGTTAAARAYDTDRGPSAVTIADVTGDGKADLLVSNYDAATVSLLPGNGDGTFQPQRTFSVGNGANALLAIDMNGDLKLDVVTANYEANSVSVLLNNGAANFNPAKNYATGAGPAALAGGDFNGDGRIDIVTANADANTLSYLQGSAATAGALNTARSLATGKGPSAIVAQDINGDGKLDVVSGNADSGDLSLLTGKGDGTFNAASVLAQVGTVAELLLKDVTGDGRADLIVSGGSPGRVSVLYGFAGGVFSASALSLPVAGPLAAPDLNGDGKADLLVGQPGGTVLLYLNATK